MIVEAIREQIEQERKRNEERTTSKIKFAKKLSRNDPCFCGSGVKLKHCCMKSSLRQRHALNSGANPLQS